uniref:Flocculation protein FLO11-like n=1 Tax=Steinernema glaseri TaxID=37863 RepID=A0A1I7YZC5_9BILA
MEILGDFVFTLFLLPLLANSIDSSVSSGNRNKRAQNGDELDRLTAQGSPITKPLPIPLISTTGFPDRHSTALLYMNGSDNGNFSTVQTDVTQKAATARTTTTESLNAQITSPWTLSSTKPELHTTFATSSTFQTGSEAPLYASQSQSLSTVLTESVATASSALPYHATISDFDTSDVLMPNLVSTTNFPTPTSSSRPTTLSYDTTIQEHTSIFTTQFSTAEISARLKEFLKEISDSAMKDFEREEGTELQSVLNLFLDNQQKLVNLIGAM